MSGVTTLERPAEVIPGTPERLPAITIRRPWIDCIAHGFKTKGASQP